MKELTSYQIAKLTFEIAQTMRLLLNQQPIPKESPWDRLLPEHKDQIIENALLALSDLEDESLTVDYGKIDPDQVITLAVLNACRWANKEKSKFASRKGKFKVIRNMS